jgi:hypothetical protein
MMYNWNVSTKLKDYKWTEHNSNYKKYKLYPIYSLAVSEAVWSSWATAGLSSVIGIV